MSYPHPNPSSRKEQLMRELGEVEKDLSHKNQSLQRLKLEQQFYEDNRTAIAPQRMNLADQIMNQLLNNKPTKPEPQPERQYPPIQHSPPRAEQQHRYEPPVRQNNFINERELQKNKLQNQKHQGLFPSSRERERVRSTERGQVQPQQMPAPEPDKNLRSPKKQKDYGDFDPRFNPFVPDEEKERQKKEAEHRAYLKQLQEQREEQQRKKEEQQKLEKQYKGQFYDHFLPGNSPKADKSKPQAVGKPLVMKKHDPNSKPPKIEPVMGNFSQFDRNLVKEKAVELKKKFKKGKIIHEEFEREWTNLKKQYPGDLEADMTDGFPNPSQPQQPSIRQLPPSPQRAQYTASHEEESRNDTGSHPIRNQSVNYSQFMPSSVQPSQNPLHTLPTHLAGSQPPYMAQMPQIPNASSVPIEYMDMVRKMFEVCMKEMRETYNQRVDQNQALQETLSKFLQQSQNPLMTQQAPIPPNPQPTPPHFYSDSKQHKEFLEKQSTKKKSSPQSSKEVIPSYPIESDTSEYYDRSLSGVASKIPLKNSSMERQAKGKQSIKTGLSPQQFFAKRYRVKPLEKFAILIDPAQSDQPIPSTSSYLRPKKAKEQLERETNEDAVELRQKQSQRDFHQAEDRIAKNSTYEQPSRNSSRKKKRTPSKGKQSTSVEDNPFLKKVISGEDPIMTFNEQKGRELGRSPDAKKEILEQEEYQTAERAREEEREVPSYMKEYEQQLKFPGRALNFIKENNNVLSKYERKETENNASSNYFSGNQLSPVKRPDRYEQSIETIRSDFESAKHLHKYIKALETPHPQPPAQSQRTYGAVSKTREEESRVAEEAGEAFRYSQTVESVEESSTRHRPPMAKRKSVGKKKESSIMRSKVPGDGSMSRISKQEEEISLSKMQMPKFDSNVYESQFEESVQRPDPKIVLQNQSRPKSPEIQINPPTVITPKSPAKLQPIEEEKSRHPSKLKSLDEARRLAKQYRSKGVEQSKDGPSYEERFSQLQSFMTRRGEQSLSSIRREPFKDRLRPKEYEDEAPPEKNKKNIMKLLEQLQDGEGTQYAQQFESYREESENYQQ